SMEYRSVASVPCGLGAGYRPGHTQSPGPSISTSTGNESTVRLSAVWLADRGPSPVAGYFGEGCRQVRRSELADGHERVDEHPRETCGEVLHGRAANCSGSG